MTEEAKPRPRKPETAATIELRMWFRSEAGYQAFFNVGFGRKAKTITDSAIERVYWVTDDPRDGIEVIFQYTHTCRNDGAHNSDSKRFFHVTRRNANLLELDAELSEVTLLSREKFGEGTAPVPDAAV